jgi:hypothetical protein
VGVCRQLGGCPRGAPPRDRRASASSRARNNIRLASMRSVPTSRQDAVGIHASAASTTGCSESRTSKAMHTVAWDINCKAVRSRGAIWRGVWHRSRRCPLARGREGTKRPGMRTGRACRRLRQRVGTLGHQRMQEARRQSADLWMRAQAATWPH